MINETGCDGVMIGRGAQGNPWIFSEILADMEGKEYTPPTLAERFEVAREHLYLMLADKGERVGLAEAKKHMAWYLAGMNGAAKARDAVMRATSAEEIVEIFNKLN